MATYRVSLKGKEVVDKKTVQKVLNNMISRQVTAYSKAGVAAMQEIRCSAVDSWYRNNTDSSMKAATNSVVESVKQNKDKVTITITSYVDTDIYNQVKASSDDARIYKWQDDWKSKLSEWNYDTPAHYLVNLQWEEGIRGLPAKATATGTGWTNRYFDQITPMKTVVAEAIAANWVTTVNKYYDKFKKG